MSRVQIIRDEKHRPAFAVVPWKDYVGLAGEDAADIAAAEEALASPDRIPADIAKRIIAGENTLKVIRGWRGMTQQDLADKSGRAKQYISQLETGHRPLNRKVANALAPALGVDVETLIG
jgi:DNA-binding XRE family transcriptional regulator